MAIANSTLHFHFPLVTGTDHPIFGDYNAAMETLDEELYAATSAVSTYATQIEALQEFAGDAITDIGNLQTFQTSQEGINEANTERFLAINESISGLNTGVASKFNSIAVADAYNPESTYNVGDVVTYNGNRYVCITQITTGEPFDADKWQAEDVETVLDGIKSDLDNKATMTALNALSAVVAEKATSERWQIRASTSSGAVILKDSNGNNLAYSTHPNIAVATELDNYCIQTYLVVENGILNWRGYVHAFNNYTDVPADGSRTFYIESITN